MKTICRGVTIRTRGIPWCDTGCMSGCIICRSTCGLLPHLICGGTGLRSQDIASIQRDVRVPQ